MSAEDDRPDPSVPAAFLGVVLIWSTTPLGIKWSTDAGFLFGVASRMLLASVLLGTLMLVARRRLPLHAAAIRAYLAATVGIFGAMMCVYWAAQTLPSGLIAVIFGMAPLITALLAAIFLGDRDGLRWKLMGGVVGVLGLWLIFRHETQLGAGSAEAMAACLLATTLYSTSAVWLKHEGAAIGAVEQATGGLLASLPLFLVAWLVAGAPWPEVVPARAVGAILYLATFGSVLGFIWFFHLLRRVRPSTAALITLITPIGALLIGRVLNDEVLPAPIWIGVTVVMAGLSLFYLGSARPWRPPAEPVP